MRIAVTSQGADLECQVDPRFGRAKFLLVVDTDTDDCQVHNNALNMNASQGAGIQAARTVVDLGVAAVVTGNVGPKAFAALRAGKVEVYPGASGTVRDAVAQFKAGAIKPAEQPNVEGHWA